MSEFDDAPRAIPIARPVPVVLPVSALDEEERPVRRKRRIPEPAVRPFAAIGSALEWLFGFAAVLVGLAVLAAIPIVQFLSLGYLLECSGRIARTGSFRSGFIGIRLGARLGGIVFASWLLLLPVRLVADYAHSASIVDPGGPIAANWRVGLGVFMGLTAFHILAAITNGGRFRHFLSPFNAYFVIRKFAAGGFYRTSRDAVWATLISLRLPYYFKLGFKGFLAAAAWLVLPASLIAVGRATFPGAGAVGVIGALLLAFVAIHLPFLQARLGETGRFGAAFELRAVRRAYRKAPWMFSLAFVATLLFALPLYLLKIEVVPREAAWLPSLVFILFMVPSRMLAGWALARANRRDEPRHGFFRWTGRVPFLPVAGVYVLFVFFAQYTSWNGVWSLYDQHAFALPVPFLGL